MLHGIRPPYFKIYLRLPAAVLLLLRHVERWLLTIVVWMETKVLRLITILWLANWLLLAVVTIPLSRNPLMLMVMVKIRLSLTSPSLSYRGSLLDSILNINLRTSVLLYRILWILRILLVSLSRHSRTQTHERDHTQHLPEHTLS